MSTSVSPAKKAALDLKSGLPLGYRATPIDPAASAAQPFSYRGLPGRIASVARSGKMETNYGHLTASGGGLIPCYFAGDSDLVYWFAISNSGAEEHKLVLGAASEKQARSIITAHEANVAPGVGAMTAAQLAALIGNDPKAAEQALASVAASLAALAPTAKSTPRAQPEPPRPRVRPGAPAQSTRPATLAACTARARDMVRTLKAAAPQREPTYQEALKAQLAERTPPPKAQPSPARPAPLPAHREPTYQERLKGAIEAPTADRSAPSNYQERLAAAVAKKKRG